MEVVTATKGHGNGRGPALRAAGWVLLIAAVCLYIRVQGSAAFRRMHGNDFKHIYLGAILIGRGQNPYDARLFLEEASRHGFRTINPYVYPPTNGLVLHFLTWWTPRRAATVWFFLNHAMLLASLALCVHWFLGWRRPWLLAITALLAATSIPLQRTLTAGQLNCALLLLYCATYWGLSRRRDCLAAFFVAFGILFKLAPGIFAAYFLCKRRWRALAWTCAWLEIGRDHV